jgi:uncharacterized membrane protein YgdD (TMEM256/DUF423 family)
MSNNWLRVTGILGTSAVVLGAVGAHAFKGKSDAMKETWKIASNYHFLHTLALGIGALHFHGKKRNVVCGLFLGGIVLFSGACYTIVLMDERKPYAQVTPFGGVLFMAGWLAFGFM